MKKLFLFIPLLFLCMVTFSQTFISESFDGTTFPPTGWAATVVQGTYNWTRQTSGTNPTCVPHAGTGMTRYYSYLASSDDNAILVTPLFDLSTSTPGTAVISFWMYRDNGYLTKEDRVNVYANITPDLTGATKIDSIYRSIDLYPVITNTGWIQCQYLIPATFTGASNYIILQAVSGFGNNIYIDDVQVYIMQPNDVGVTAVLSPVSSLCGYSNDSLSVIVKNFGSNPQLDIPVHATVIAPSGTLNFDNTLFGVLAPLASDTLFLDYINTSDDGTYDVTAYTTLPGDNLFLNDTTDYNFATSPALSIPHMEDFEGATPLANWNTNMTRGTGHGGTTSYVLYKNLYSATTDTAQASMNQKVGPVTSDTYLSFDYRYINYSGGTACTLDLDTLRVFLSNDCGSTFTPIYTICQTNHIPTTDSTYIEIPIGAFAGSDVMVKFIASWGGTGDYYIDLDNISFFNLPDYDAGITLFNQPVTPVAPGGGNVSVTVKNFGLQNLTSATIAWTIDGTLQTPQPYSNSGLAHNTTESSVYIGTHNLSTPGFHTLKAWTENPNGNTDEDYSNDTATYIVYVQNYAPLPFTENFDAAWVNKFDNHDVPSEFWTGTPATGNSSWRRDDEGSTGGWGSLTNGTYSPAGAESTLHSARFHTYSASAGSTGIMDIFLDFTPAGDKILKFWYINETQSGGYDSLGVYLSTDAGTTFAFIDQFQFADVWTEYTVALGSSTSGNVVLRLIGTSDYYSTDIGLDNVEVYIPQLDDVGVTTFLSPVSSLCGNSNDSLSVIVKNFGSNPQIDVPVHATVVTPTGTLNFDNTLFGVLDPNTSDTLFLDYINTSADGIYYVTAYTVLPGDNSLLNDTVHYNFSTAPALTIPHMEDFEGATPLANWNTNMTSGTGHGGTTSKVIYKNLYSTSNDTAQATMNQKTGPVTLDTYLSFDYRYINYSGGTAYTLDLDTLKVFLSDDCGSTFTPIYTVSPANHNPTTDSTYIEIPIGAFAGSNVIVKFVASWGGIGDYYIDLDNIFFSKPCFIDLGSDSVLCADLNMVLDAGAGFDTYSWSTGETTQTITVDTSGIGLGAFDFWVDVTSATCSTSDTINIIFTPCTGVIENAAAPGLSINPNPTTGLTSITLAGLKENADLTIYNMKGAVVYKESINSDTKSVSRLLDLSYLPKGVYLVRINNDKNIVAGRLIIQ
jgi:hypothetical protein